MGDTLPHGLAGMPTGPGLCAELAVLDPHHTEDEPLLELLSAQSRQLAYQQAQQWAVMAEIAVRDPMPNLPGGARWSPEQIFESAVDEIRAELCVTRRSARRELEHATAVTDQPRIMAALSRGELDRTRAIVLAEGCLDLTDQQTTVVLDELLPAAATVTATGLADKLRRVAIALDPAWAERRYREAIRDRKVIGYLNPDGSATVSGQNLPADAAAYACARVDALADTAKRAGAAARIDHLRAELFLGLLDGSLHTLPDTAIITELLRRYPKPTAQATEDTPTEDAAPDAKQAPASSPCDVTNGPSSRVVQPGTHTLSATNRSARRNPDASRERCEPAFDLPADELREPESGPDPPPSTVAA
jgi:hypothetical protein